MHSLYHRKFTHMMFKGCDREFNKRASELNEFIIFCPAAVAQTLSRCSTCVHKRHTLENAYSSKISRNQDITKRKIRNSNSGFSLVGTVIIAEKFDNEQYGLEKMKLQDLRNFYHSSQIIL